MSNQAGKIGFTSRQLKLSLTVDGNKLATSNVCFPNLAKYMYLDRGECWAGCNDQLMKSDIECFRKKNCWCCVVVRITRIHAMIIISCIYIFDSKGNHFSAAEHFLYFKKLFFWCVKLWWEYWGILCEVTWVPNLCSCLVTGKPSLVGGVSLVNFCILLFGMLIKRQLWRKWYLFH